MNISMNTLMLSIKAVERDLQRCEQLAKSETLSDEEADEYGQYVLDLTQALSELGGVYDVARSRHPKCPTLDELIPSFAHASAKDSL